MDKHEVSVIFATYNGRDLLERSLVLYEKQTNMNFEIIAISDDCSDGTYEMLRQRQKQARNKDDHPEKGTWEMEGLLRGYQPRDLNGKGKSVFTYPAGGYAWIQSD